VFVLVAAVAHRWVLPLVARWLPEEPEYLIMLAALVLFALGGIAELGGLGVVVGAITAGVVLRPAFDQAGAQGERARRSLHEWAYGFFGLIFFFWVGLSVDVGGMMRAPLLAILLFLSAFVGKLIGVFALVPMGKLRWIEAWTVGIGVNARLTTEIIVAKLLLEAGLINTDLFTALVAASSLSTLGVPLAFTVLVKRWAPLLGAEPAGPEAG